jgi:hypothetical protein
VVRGTNSLVPDYYCVREELSDRDYTFPDDKRTRASVALHAVPPNSFDLVLDISEEGEPQK